jgi:hypothetical protein
VSLLAQHVLQKVEIVVLDLEQLGIHALDGLGIIATAVVAHPNGPKGGAKNYLGHTDTLKRWHLSSAPIIGLTRIH